MLQQVSHAVVRARDRLETAGEGYIESTYDAAGQLVYYTSTAGQAETQINRYYNGDGREVKRKERRYMTLDGENWDWAETISYYIRSTVLGGEVVSDSSDSGVKVRT